GNEGKRALVRPALTDAIGGAHIAPRPEGLRVEIVDLLVVRRLFRQVGKVAGLHDNWIPLRGTRTGRGRGRTGDAIQARLRRRSIRNLAKAQRSPTFLSR